MSPTSARRRQAAATESSSPPSSPVAVPSQPPVPTASSNGLVFTRATKRQAKLRLTLDGPSGSGKTYSALAIAEGLGEKIALIDTEHGSASKYAADPFHFDTLTLESFEPRTYVKAIHAAEAAGYDVLIIDSLTHAWAGKGGALEQVDQRAGVKGNKFSAWRDVTPMHNELVDAMLGARLHLIATMRTKTEYVMEDDKGKVNVRKLGMAPIQRDGMEYEFDVVGDLDLNHNLHVTKTRCRVLDDAIIAKPGEQLARTLNEWLSSGEPMLPPKLKPEVVPLENKKQESESRDGRMETSARPGLALTPEQQQLLAHLAKTLNKPLSLTPRLVRDWGGFLPTRDRLLAGHREEHGEPCSHWPEAILASAGGGE